MSISLKSLMDFFHKKTNNRKYSKIYRDVFELLGLYAEFEISSMTTLKQLFDGTAGMLYENWNPGYDKDKYFAKIENRCLIFKCLFVDGIAEYCYTNFNFFEFLGKYNLTESSKI